MAKNCIGLDLGSSAVKVTQVKKKGSGFQLLNFGIEPIPPDTIVDGAILNHSGVVDAVRALFDRLKIKQKGSRSRSPATPSSSRRSSCRR